MSAAAPVAIPALDNTFGAILIGCIIGAALWGVGTLQLYLYYLNYPEDNLGLKLFVTVTWAFDTVQQALIGHVVYYYLIKNYFNPLSLDNYVWSFNVQSLFEALTSFCVQSFFFYRIVRLSNRNYLMSGIAAVLILAKFGTSLAYTSQGFHLHSIRLAFSKLHKISEAIDALAAVTDVVIASMMCWLLFRSRTAFSKTNRLISRLITYTINTGALTSLCAVVTFITAQTMQTNFVYGTFYFLIARLYVNSMLATLNVRQSLSRDADQDTEINEISTSNISGSARNIPFHSAPKLDDTTGMRFKASKTSEVSSDALSSDRSRESFAQGVHSV